MIRSVSFGMQVDDVRARLDKCKGSSTADLSKCGLSKSTLESVLQDLATFATVNFANNTSLDDVPSDLRCLADVRTLFFLGCAFKDVPAVLGQLKNLYMLSFKSQVNGGLQHVPDDCLADQIGWLILTDNALASLPAKLGSLACLRKLMLASNQLTSLPDFSGCVSLELVRLSDNELGEDALTPHVGGPLHSLLQAPKLAWLALGGNKWGPCAKREGDSDPTRTSFALSSLPSLAMHSLAIGPMLGTGASGNVHAACTADGRQVALKLFRGGSSDGRAVDEALLCLRLGSVQPIPHPHIVYASHWAWGVPTSAQDGQTLSTGGAHMLATVLPLYEGIKPLAKPPSFDTVTRDVYTLSPGAQGCYPLWFVTRVLKAIASAMHHLHKQGICHGDLYAHNILVDEVLVPATADAPALRPLSTDVARVLLSDFGAAFAYDRSAYDTLFEKVEVRAFGCLIEELLERCVPLAEAATVDALSSLSRQCQVAAVSQRPTFDAITGMLQDL